MVPPQRRPTRRLPVPPLRVRALVVVVTAAALVAVLALAPTGTSVAAGELFASLRQPGEPGFVAGHRGGQDAAPENTMAAFRLAIERGVDVLETDVQLTSDGVPVLLHDWTLDRTTNGTGPIWEIDSARLAELDAGQGEHVPTLAEFLALLAETGHPALIELKGAWTPEQTRLVTAPVVAFGLASHVMLASFDITTLGALAETAPEIPRIVIVRQVVGDPTIIADLTGAIAIVTSRTFVERDPDAVARIHAAGLGVLVYTLNDEDAWSQAVALGVDGIITDRASRFGAWLDENVGGMASGG